MHHDTPHHIILYYTKLQHDKSRMNNLNIPNKFNLNITVNIVLIILSYLSHFLRLIPAQLCRILLVREIAQRNVSFRVTIMTLISRFWQSVIPHGYFNPTHNIVAFD